MEHLGFVVQAAHKVEGPGGTAEWRPDAFLTVTGDSIAADGVYLLENSTDVRPIACSARLPVMHVPHAYCVLVLASGRCLWCSAARAPVLLLGASGLFVRRRVVLLGTRQMADAGPGHAPLPSA